jgi:hypothetical protein
LNLLATGGDAFNVVLSHTQAKSKFHWKIPPKISHSCDRRLLIHHFTAWRIKVIFLIPNSDS